MEEKGCCEKKGGKLAQGIIYGLVPHIGCIAFIVGSVLGVTMLTEFFRPMLMNPYFFQILIAISIGFATLSFSTPSSKLGNLPALFFHTLSSSALSSALYLRRNNMLTTAGIKHKWKYLSTMYGSTIGVNILLFLVVFPLLANVSFAQTTGNFQALADAGSLSELTLQVDIPCSGHASLITGEIKSLAGITGVKFSLPNTFEVQYDSGTVTKEQILSLGVFKSYGATIIYESAAASTQSLAQASASLCGQNDEGYCNGSCGCGGE